MAESEILYGNIRLSQSNRGEGRGSLRDGGASASAQR